MMDQFIFASGGVNDNAEDLRSVERYANASNEWAEMPQLNVARASHGSCVLATAVYAVCGYNSQHGFLNLVEKLETRDLEAGWLLIQIPPTSLKPREWPIVSALNASEILIMGGYDGEYLGDALTLDTHDQSVRMVIADAPLRFSQSKTAPVVQVRSGVVFTQACVRRQGQKLVSFSNNSI